MRLSLAAFTQRGGALLERLRTLLEESGHSILDAHVFGAASGGPQIRLADWTGRAFSGDGILYIGACGIAVRAVSGYLKDKFQDPAVVVIDEKGKFCISLLSGHVGGANALALEAARLLEATPVITTATDVNGRFAVDVWASAHNMHICERALAKEVSAALLRGEQVGFASAFALDGELPAGVTWDKAPVGFYVGLDDKAQPFQRTLHLIPRIVTLGTGCRRNVESGVYASAVEGILSENHISMYALKQAATIDLKKEEACILAFCEAKGLALKVYSAAELAQAHGDFSSSGFVKNVTGVDNVCERAAVLAGGENLIMRKQSSNAVTAAAAADIWRVCFGCPNDGN